MLKCLNYFLRDVEKFQTYFYNVKEIVILWKSCDNPFVGGSLQNFSLQSTPSLLRLILKIWTDFWIIQFIVSPEISEREISEKFLDQRIQYFWISWKYFLIVFLLISSKIQWIVWKLSVKLILHDKLSFLCER